VLAAAVLAAAALVAPVRGPPPGGAADPSAALRAAAADPTPLALVWLLAVEALALGALDVLYVVLAVGVLGRGGSVAGYLNAAFGAGGVIGVGATVALVGRSRLGPPLLAGLLVWAVALACLGLVDSLGPAFALLALAGLGRTVLDVAGRTLLQRIARPNALARVFGLLEGASMAGLAVGSLAASAFVALAGERGAFLCVAAALPVAALVVLRRVLAADLHVRPVVEMARLRALPIFAPLGAPALEGVARCLQQVEVAPGTSVIREGERGDRFYVVADGAVAVSVRGETVATLGRGDCFGEIALLRDVPRTATVVAATATRLDTLDGPSFVAAVTGHAPSLGAADALVRDRLGRARLAP
jgi:MFS family permease